MKKPVIVVLGFILAAGMALRLIPAAAQGSAAGKSSTTGQSAATPKASKTPAAKTGTSPARKPRPAVALKNQKDKVSYSLGLNIGAGMRAQGVEIDPNVFLLGLQDALAGGKTLMTIDEALATLKQWRNEMQARLEAKRKQQGETNKSEGEAFLAANKSKEGVVTLPSGLQYKVLTEGTGPKPAATDTVECNYRGTLLNGREFDSSAKHGQPAKFLVSGLIKGWAEALQLMPVGSKWQLIVPPDLAYTDRGAGNDIGPNATLVFEVELLSIQGK